MEGYEIFEKRRLIDKRIIKIILALLDNEMTEEEIFQITKNFLENEIEENPELFDALIDKDKKINELIESAKRQYQKNIGFRS